MSDSIYDDPDMADVGGEFVKFEKPGDTVSGHVNDVRRGTDFAGNPCPQLGLTDDNGEPRIVTAGQTKLKQLVVAQRPGVGDYVTVTYSSDMSLTGGRSMKVFTVEVIKGGKAKVEAAAGRTGAYAGAKATSEPPF